MKILQGDYALGDMVINIIVLDVDGTLTDGSIYYGDNDVETKKFNTKDAAGILAAQAVDIPCMILTGRSSEAVTRRGQDLHVKYVVQGISDKEAFLRDFLMEKGINAENALYVGDDLNDVACMKLVGHVACPIDAADEVKEISEYISKLQGGHGAVRDCIFYYLKRMNIYEEAIKKAYAGI